MRTRVSLVFLAILLLSFSADAFDNQRKGFVIGAGLGAGPMTTDWERDGEIKRHSVGGLGLHWMIGYGLTSRDIVVVHRMVGFHFERGSDDVYSTFIEGQGLGITYFRYFRQASHSAFGAIGAGKFYQSLEHAEWGTGLLHGAGYQFSKRWQVGAYYIRGWTEADNGIKVDGGVLLYMITVVWK